MLRGTGLVLIGALLAAAPQEDSGSIEYRVKAAYLLNFARYVEWPDAAFASPDEPFLICVMGTDPFGPNLDRTVAGHLISGRNVVPQRLKDGAGAERCHIVYVGRDGPEDSGRTLQSLASRPILTVGETRAFLTEGGAVRFLLVDETVRFEVNLQAAQRAGLRISSRMLSFAYTVQEE
jgi:hypothetical protein